MESVNFIISAIAVFISIIVAVCDFRLNCRINRLNMEADIFQKIFFDYLIHKFPEAQQNIKNTPSGLTGTGMLEDELNNLRKDALFFFYHDDVFYSKLCNKLQLLEDKVVRSNDRKMSEIDYHMFTDELKKYITEIYELVMNQYEGIKKR